MAKISEMDGRSNGAYSKLFGDKKRGLLISQTHAASIRAGSELERFIADLIPDTQKNTLNNIAHGKIKNEHKEIIISPKKPKSGENRAIVSDFAIFYHKQYKFSVIELKAGDMFDTQKAPATKENLQQIVEHISTFTNYAGGFYICSFNATCADDIVRGFKGAFNQNQVITGQEFCNLIDVSYGDILKRASSDQEDNRKYFDKMAGLAADDQIDEQDYQDSVNHHKTGQYSINWNGENNE